MDTLSSPKRATAPFVNHRQHLPVTPPRNGSRRLGIPGEGAQLLARRGAVMVPAAAKKTMVQTIVTYTVQKGDTLWDVAAAHGVSMRAIKDLNKLSGTEPAIKEGQQLLVPASGITEVEKSAEPPVAKLADAPARGLWAGSENVRLIDVEDARTLYRQQCDRLNTQHTLLVVYAPWCPHCRDFEDELERLAEGLSRVHDLRVVALNGDTPDGRQFAREVLGVAYFPSLVAFPQHSRTFYKYKGRSRDAESLLRFLNVTCCGQEEAMWALGASTGKGAVVQAPGSGFLGLSPAAANGAALAGGFLLLAGLLALLAGRGSKGVEQEVVAELDSSMGKMAGLMLRVVRTRLALLFGVASVPGPDGGSSGGGDGASGGGGVDGGGGGAVAAAAAPAASVPAGLVPPAAPLAPSQAALRAAAALDSTRVRPAGGADAQLQGSAAGSTAGLRVPAVLAASAVAYPEAPTSTSGNGNGHSNGNSNGSGELPPGLGSASIASSRLSKELSLELGLGLEDSASMATARMARELSAADRQRLTRLTDDELIALVNSDPDLNNVLSKLLGDKSAR